VYAVTFFLITFGLLVVAGRNLILAFLMAGLLTIIFYASSFFS
jgi:hypothetical protein|tara:strand:+ start:532 stop:660 length:129 start_codon:yes stop_codon:yes gene_type:complete